MTDHVIIVPPVLLALGRDKWVGDLGQKQQVLRASALVLRRLAKALECTAAEIHPCAGGPAVLGEVWGWFPRASDPTRGIRIVVPVDLGRFALYRAETRVEGRCVLMGANHYMPLNSLGSVGTFRKYMNEIDIEHHTDSR